MTDLSYSAELTYKNNRYIISFPDLIDGITVAKTVEEIPERAKSLMLDLLALMKCWRQEPPEPTYAPEPGEYSTIVSATFNELEDAIKILRGDQNS